MKTFLIAVAALVLAGCASLDNAPASTLDRFTVEQH